MGLSSLKVTLATLLLVVQVQGLSLALCSEQNTGSSSSQGTDQFNSNGLCHDRCAGHAFAIVQGYQCWCSDYAPASQAAMALCNVPCPGFPSERCGSVDDGVYGYVALDGNVSGTMGASSTSGGSSSAHTTTLASSQLLQALSSSVGRSTTSSSTTSTSSTSSTSSASSTSSSSSSTSTTASTTSTTSTSSTTSTTSDPPSSSQNPTTSQDPTTSDPPSTSYIPTSISSSTFSSSVHLAPSTTHTYTPTTLVSTIYSVRTISGDNHSTVTQTLLQTMTMSSASASPSASSSELHTATPQGHSSFFDNRGRVAGVFSALGIVSLLLLLALAYLIYKKCVAKRLAADEYYGYYDGGSDLDRRQSVSGVPRIDYSDLESNPHQREYEKRESGVTETYSVSPTTPTASPTTRNKLSFPVDPRLDPNSPLYRDGSMDFSSRSLSDEVDYSRKVLKVMNV